VPRTTVSLSHCSVRGTRTTLAAVHAAACLSADACNLEGSAGGGVAAGGNGTALELTGCVVGDAAGALVLAADGVAAELTDCILAASRDGAGLEGRGTGTRIVARDCRVRYNARSGVLLSGGAEAELACVRVVASGAHGVEVKSGAALQARVLTATGDGHHALHVHGKGSKAALDSSTLQHAAICAAAVDDGGNLILDGCVLEDSAASHGLAAVGAGTLVAACATRVRRNKGHGVSLAAGARAALWAVATEANGTHGIAVADGSDLKAEHCTVSSEPAAGVDVGGAGARALLASCTVRECAWTAVCVSRGAAVDVRCSELAGARESNGLQVEGDGSRARAQHVALVRNRGAGVHVADGARAELTACRSERNGRGAYVVIASGTLHAQRCGSLEDGEYGVLVEGAGASAAVERCRITGARGSAVGVQGGAQARLARCTLAGSARDGLSVAGAGSRALVLHSTLQDNAHCGAAADGDDAHAALSACRSHSNRASGFRAAAGARLVLDRCTSHCEAPGVADGGVIEATSASCILGKLSSGKSPLLLLKALSLLVVLAIGAAGATLPVWRRLLPQVSMVA
jgi:Right handed beta helix region